MRCGSLSGRGDQRQGAKALAGDGEERVGDGRGDRGNADLFRPAGLRDACDEFDRHRPMSARRGRPMRPRSRARAGRAHSPPRRPARRRGRRPARPRSVAGRCPDDAARRDRRRRRCSSRGCRSVPARLRQSRRCTAVHRVARQSPGRCPSTPPCQPPIAAAVDRQWARRGCPPSMLDAEGQRFDLRLMRQLVDEAFGEEGGVAVGIAAPAPDRQVERRRDNDRSPDGGWHKAASRRQRRVHRRCARRPRAARRPTARGNPVPALAVGGRRGDLRRPAVDTPARQQLRRHPRPAGGRGRSATISSSRDQISCTGRPTARAISAACTAGS